MPPLTVYASSTDLTALGVNPDAIVAVNPTAVTEALTAASRLIDSALRPQFTLPLTQAGLDVSRACAIIAAYDLLVTRGFNPAAGADQVFVDRYLGIVGDPPFTDKNGWLAAVSKGSLIPDVTDSSPAAAEGRPSARARCVSSSQRGYSGRQGTQQTNTGTNGPFTTD